MKVPTTATASKQVLFIECALPRWLILYQVAKSMGRQIFRSSPLTKKMRLGIAVVLLWFACYLRLQAADEKTSEEAKRYFREARTLCERDSGMLWNKSLCGPILLVDPESSDLFADQADREHQLESRDGLFVGKLPANVNVANTATEWGGVKWTMLMLPLPADPQRRAVLLAH